MSSLVRESCEEKLARERAERSRERAGAAFWGCSERMLLKDASAPPGSSVAVSFWQKEEGKSEVMQQTPSPAFGSAPLTLVMVMLMICVVRRRPERVLQPDSSETSPREPTLLSSLGCVRLAMGVK